MPRLKSRQQQIPNGMRFAIPEANWKSPPFASFDSIVHTVSSIVAANPELAQQKGWPQTREGIADWVDEFNAQLCAQNGWTNYYNEGGGLASLPKPVPLSVAKNVAAGAKTLANWIGSGAQPVTPSLAEARAKVCSKCPVMQQGDMSNFFTRATSEIIRMQVQTAQELDMVTPYDKQLGVCGACSCPMRLKVWVGLTPILEGILPEAKAALDVKCWILDEEKESLARDSAVVDSQKDTKDLTTIVVKTPE